MIVISCIKPWALKKIRNRGGGTIELISQQNVSAVENLQEGDLVFLTNEGEEDTAMGSEGVIVRVEKISVGYYRHCESHADEWEIKRARLRVRFVSPATVHRVVHGKVTMADVDPHDHLLIG